MERIHRLAYGLVLTLFVLLPFHAFLVTVLNFGLKLNTLAGAGIMNAWKEMLLLVLSGLFVAKIFYESRHQHKKFWHLLHFDALDWAIVGYVVFGLVHFMLLKSGLIDALFGTSFHEVLTISHMIWGARYNYLFLFAFLLIRHFQFSQKEVQTMLKTVLVSGFVAIISAFVIYFIIKPENLVAVGFRNDWSIPKPFEAPPFCQKIEARDLCRMSGTFAGPNQFGAFTAIFLPLTLWWFQKRRDLFQGWLQSVFFPVSAAILTSVGLLLSFSRSAYLGAAVGLFFLGLSYKKWRKYVAAGAISILVLAGAAYVLSPDLQHILLRPGSTSGHLSGLWSGLQGIVAQPFGQGLGTSGPASSYLGQSSIPESWHLQIGFELGIFGLLLWLAVLVFMLRSFVLEKYYYLCAGLLGLTIAAFFLHTFEDAPTTLMFFMLGGGFIGIGKKSNYFCDER